MCCEDVIIGRHTITSRTVVEITTASKQLVKPSPTRVGLIIGEPLTGEIYLDTEPIAAAGTGIHVHFNVAPLILSDATLGSLIRAGWYAMASIGTQQILVLEVHLTDMCKETRK